MRALIAGTALLMLAGVANANPWGWGGGPGYGFGPPPPRPVFDRGYGHGWGGPPRRCWWVDGFYGPRKVCRGGW